MSTLTSNQLRELSEALTLIADSLADYIDGNWNNIPELDRDYLRDQRQRLREESQRLLAEATIVEIGNHINEINAIREVTNKISEVLSTISNIGKVVNIATSTVAMAISISTGNIGGISAAVTDIIDVLDSEE